MTMRDEINRIIEAKPPAGHQFIRLWRAELVSLMEAAYAAGQREADERAAQIAEMTPDMMGTSQQIAAAIRNRKEQG